MRNLSLTFLLVVAMFGMFGCKTSYKGPVSDHFDGQSFYNPGGTAPKGFLDLLKWQFSGGRQKWPAEVINNVTPQLDTVLSDNDVNVTFVNHAMVLLQFKGLNILTDPHLSQRASPFSWIGPKRVRAPGIAFEQLPKIDVIAISHNHYDHFDIPTLKRIAMRDQPRIFIPLGDGKLLDNDGIGNYQEMDWWQEAKINSSTAVIFTPCHHWSARGMFDRNKSLWGSYTFVHNGAKMHFGGDTGYSDHFKRIHARLGAMAFSMLPIGAYEPRWFMRDQHMNPEDAVQAHIDLNSKKSMGIHYGTFQLTDEGIDDPVTQLKKVLAEKGIPEEDFITLEVGESRKLDLSL